MDPLTPKDMLVTGNDRGSGFTDSDYPELLLQSIHSSLGDDDSLDTFFEQAKRIALTTNPIIIETEVLGDKASGLDLVTVLAKEPS